MGSSRHCMDLILGATFPAKDPYKMTPMENEEINKQVQEILDKGVVIKLS